jgi:hypothetical protein
LIGCGRRDEGGEGGSGGQGAGGAVELGGGHGNEAVDGAGPGLVVEDAVVVCGEAAGNAVAFLVGALGHGTDVAEEAAQIEVGQADEGRMRERRARGDGGSGLSPVAADEGEAEEGGRVPLGDTALAGEQAAGGGERG